jgi:hypothetical protein
VQWHSKLIARRRANAAAWAQFARRIVAEEPQSTPVWLSPQAISEVLQPFLSLPNIAFWSSPGFRNLVDVRIAREPQCLEFRSTVEAPCILRPRRLILQFIDHTPSESFLVLELNELQPSGVYERDDGSDHIYEEIRELPSGRYVERNFDDGLEADEDYEERQLPRGSRVVTRWFRGQILIVSPSSLLAAVGCDAHWGTADEIRSLVEQVLSCLQSGKGRMRGAERLQ